MKNKLVIGLVLALVAVTLIPTGNGSSADAADTKKTNKIELNDENTLILNDEVNGETVGILIEQARALDAKLFVGNKPIYLFLNTPGGSIQAGLELIEALKGLKRPVHTITMFSASMGFQIAQALGERYILKNGVLMSHRARGGFEGEFGGQSPSQIDSRYGFWMDRLKEMDLTTVERTKGKQTLASYQAMYASEMWRTGSKSVEQGYADKVVTLSCNKSLEGVSTHKVLVMGFIPVQYDLSNCPINTSPMNIQIGLRTNKGYKTVDQFTSESGGFGYACLQQAAKDPNTLCATDLQLTLETVYQTQNNFKTEFDNKRRQVIYMTIGK